MLKDTNNIIVITGGFDPIHSGHIEYIKDASNYGKVVIGLNSDEWLQRKKGKSFMTFGERYTILSELKGVLCVIGFDDTDDTACAAISKAKEMFPDSNIIFGNGGDRKKENIPEQESFKSDSRVEFIFSIGGDNKKNSSSWILSEWSSPTKARIWGEFITYYDSSQVKVKRLVLAPGKSISMQYHNKRSEYWFVESGIGTVSTLLNNEEKLVKALGKFDSFEVPLKEWHRLKNTGAAELCIVEIQYGATCTEEDIIRHKEVR